MATPALSAAVGSPRRSRGTNDADYPFGVTVAPGPEEPPEPSAGTAPYGDRFDLRGRSLRAHAARGTLINGGFMAGLALVSFLRGFALAALLTPDDFGVWGILLISLGTLTWLKQVGISDKYIQQEDADQEVAFQRAFTLELIFNTGLLVLAAAALPLIVVAYGEPKLLGPGLVLLALLPALTLQAPLWILYRRMRFARQRALQAIDPLLGLAVAVVLAIAGAGYWALVAGALVGAWASAIAAVVSCPYPLRLRYDGGSAREYMRFSGPLVVAGASSLVMAQGTMFLGEATAGLAAAGAITLAASISQVTDRVDSIITSTLYPAICAVAQRTELLYESFVKSNRLALMWAMPFGLALALFAPDLVAFVLGGRWEVAVPLIQAFGVIAAVGHLGFNWGAYFRARGQTRPIAVYGVTALGSFLVITAPLLVAFGLDGLAVGMLATTLIGLVVRAVYLTRLFAGFQLLSHALRALAPTVPAVGAVIVVRALEDTERTALLALGELTVYLAVTAAVTVLFERRLLSEAIGYLRGRDSSPLSHAAA